MRPNIAVAAINELLRILKTETALSMDQQAT